ncbi:MAG TPA: FAD-dependent oxidoreductase, partial [Phnomibacter sp.]|nr:FAD-dependent oxidoreductase [Phnomibacter sp.]
MHTQVIIVGQGLCGTWLSYWLWQAGVEHLVFQPPAVGGSSQVASGVINPVTGRRMSTTWMADSLLPFAREAYTQMGSHLGQELIRQVQILDFFYAPDRRLAFETLSQQGNPWLQWPLQEQDMLPFINYGLGYGIISPAYCVQLQAMLLGWQAFLLQKGWLRTEAFDAGALQLLQNGVAYHGITANQLLFADGAAAAASGYFSLLPFALNKGEALIIEAPDLPPQYIYKKSNTIVPWQQPGQFWVGSTYQNQYAHAGPTPEFYHQTAQWLQQTMAVPFKVVGHLAAIRPATVERRPFVGMHPQYAQVGLLNGMGTKGVSMAPYFAKELVSHLLQGAPITPAAQVQRF